MPGGGQFYLAGAGTVLAVGTLAGLRWVDARIPREQRIIVVIHAGGDETLCERINPLVRPLGFRAEFVCQSSTAEDQKVQFEMVGKCAEVAGAPLNLLNTLKRTFDVGRFEIKSEPHD